MKRFSLAFLLLAACSENPQQAPQLPPVPVRIEEVLVKDVPLFFEAMGTITPYQIAEVKPQIQGLITAIHFKEGQEVKKGDLLYTIDPIPYEIKVKEAEALLLQNLANFNNARKKLERFKNLSKQDLIAPVEWDELESKIALFDAMVQAADAGVAAAKLNLEYCRITAPISGRTGKTSLAVGNMVAVGTTLVTLSQEKPLFVDFGLSEKELQKLPSPNPAVEIYVSAQEECLARGEVTFLDHNIDPKSGLLAARAQLTTLSKPLWGGQMVRVHLFFGKKEQATLIPLKAIKTNQIGPYIFIAKEDDTVELRNVKLGPEEKGMIVVEEGLEKNSRIVTEGQSRLFPGSKIEEYRQ